MTKAGRAELDPSWSPARRQRIAFVRRHRFQGQLWIVGADGRGTRRLTREKADETTPAWSPDGKWIAFSTDLPGTHQIYVIHPDGTGLRRVTVSATDDLDPTWSPNGNQIAYARVNGLFVIGADGTGTRQVTAGSVFNRPGDRRERGMKLADSHVRIAEPKTGLFPMTAFVAAGRRHLPRGWLDLGRQLAIWFGFLVLYQVARGVADRDPTRAFENGLGVIRIEERVGDLFELTAANLIAGSHFLTFLVSWTYWNSEFTVVGLTLLFVYVRRHDYFHRFRNWILLANVIGLVGYVVVPTAPPRMFPTFGFPDTLRDFGGLNHGSGVIEFAANPYAAMPSLHAADALIVGLTMSFVCRRWWSRTLWLLWPAWVWFAVMASGNHFWLDILAGIVVVILAAVVVYHRPLVRRLLPTRA